MGSHVTHQEPSTRVLQLTGKSAQGAAPSLWGPRGSAVVWDAGSRHRAQWKELSADQQRGLARMRSSPTEGICPCITHCAYTSCQETAQHSGDRRAGSPRQPHRAPAGRQLPDDPDPLVCPHRACICPSGDKRLPPLHFSERVRG